MYAIKAKAPGDKQWAFVTPRGSVNRLRVYATLYPNREVAERQVEQLRRDNPGVEFKVVEQ